MAVIIPENRVPFKIRPGRPVDRMSVIGSRAGDSGPFLELPEDIWRKMRFAISPEPLAAELAFRIMPNTKFHRELAAESGRTLILSTCLECGATEKCSIMNRSLEVWEKSHRCANPPDSMDN